MKPSYFIPLSFCKPVFPCDYHFESQDHAKNIFNLRSMQTMSFFPLWLALFYRVNNVLRKAAVNLPFRQNPPSINSEKIFFVQLYCNAFEQ